MTSVRKLTGKLVRSKLKGNAKGSLNKKMKKTTHAKSISNYIKKINA